MDSNEQSEHVEPVFTGPQLEYVYIRRLTPDGRDLGVIDVPKSHVEFTLRNNPSWRVVGPAEEIATPPPVPKTEEAASAFECPLCGKSFKTNQGLQLHKTKAHA